MKFFDDWAAVAAKLSSMMRSISSSANAVAVAMTCGLWILMTTYRMTTTRPNEETPMTTMTMTNSRRENPLFPMSYRTFPVFAWTVTVVPPLKVTLPWAERSVMAPHEELQL